MSFARDEYACLSRLLLSWISFQKWIIANPSGADLRFPHDENLPEFNLTDCCYYYLEFYVIAEVTEVKSCILHIV